MAENIAAGSRFARPPSSSTSSNETRQRQHVRCESHSNDDADGVRSVLAAAIGLTNLSVPATTSSPTTPQNKRVAAPSVNAPSDGVAYESVAVQQKQHQPEKKKLKTSTKSLATNVAANQPASAPLYSGQLSRLMRQNDSLTRSAEASLPLPARQRTKTKTAHRRHLGPTHPLNLTFSTQLRWDAPAGKLTMPLGRQEVSQRPWMVPSKQQNERPRLQLSNTKPISTISNSSSLNFPETLYRILSDPSYEDILSWLPHGRGFSIHDKQLFVSEILPRFFEGAKFTSFTRRLKRWNFERVPRYPDIGSYYNKYFLRGRPDLVRLMMCGTDADGEQLLMQGARESSVGNVNLNEEKKQTVAARVSMLDNGDFMGQTTEVQCQKQHQMQHQRSNEPQRSCLKRKSWQHQEPNLEQEFSLRRGSPSLQKHPNPYSRSADQDNVEMLWWLQKEPSPPRKARSSPEAQQNLPIKCSAPHSPKGYLAMAIADRKMSERQTFAARHYDSIADTSDATLSEHHLNVISPTDGNHRLLFGDRTSNSNVGKMSRVMAQKKDNARDTESSFMDIVKMNNRRVIADQEIMLQKMMTLATTHKDIMTMASRDLESRDSNVANNMGRREAQHLHQQRPQPRASAMQHLRSKRYQMLAQEHEHSQRHNQRQLEGQLLSMSQSIRRYSSSQAMANLTVKADKEREGQAAAWFMKGECDAELPPLKRKNSRASAA
mmetsp:Transcript_24628/g.52256  ORF Transcript_24628/g.52256 Transcript_24628/m.52256 type:complete len:717 (-) Transcript_24628:148-2298(-)